MPMATAATATPPTTYLMDPRTGKPRRDALTGAPIPANATHIMRIRTERIDYVPPKRDRQHVVGLTDLLDLIETTPIPLAIDSTQPYPEGKLGGKRWTPEFARYIPMLPSEIADGDRELVEWWATAYGYERVKRGFAQRYGAARGQVAFDAALAILRDGEDHADVAERCGHILAWVDRQCHLAYHFAFRRATVGTA